MAVADETWREVPRRGTGWVSFAAALMVVGGIFKIGDALWAFKYDDEVADQVQTIFFERDPVAWGWLWLAIGILLIVAGFAVIRAAEWARWFGIVAAALSAILNYPWIFVQPIWTMLSVTLALLAVYGLAAHGGHHLRELYENG